MAVVATCVGPAHGIERFFLGWDDHFGEWWRERVGLIEFVFVEFFGLPFLQPTWIMEGFDRAGALMIGKGVIISRWRGEPECETQAERGETGCDELDSSCGVLITLHIHPSSKKLWDPPPPPEIDDAGRALLGNPAPCDHSGSPITPKGRPGAFASLDRTITSTDDC